MARTDPSDYLNHNQMPPGRHGFALTLMREVAVNTLGEGNALLPAIDHALAQSETTLETEHRWELTKKAKETRSRGGAHEMKQRVTRKLTDLHSIVRGRSDGDDDVAAAARQLLTVVFPNGVAGISQQRFEVMLGTVQTLLRTQLRSELKAEVEKVGVEREVGMLETLTARFADELRPQMRGQVSFDTVEEERHALHEATSDVLIEVLHLTSKRNFPPTLNGEPTTDEDRVRVREALLAEFNHQQELVSEAYGRHQMPLDVDPKTGEVRDPDADPSDDTDPSAGGDTDPSDGDNTDPSAGGDPDPGADPNATG